MSIEAPIEVAQPAEGDTYLSIVALVSDIADENVLYNTYPANGTGPVRLMSRVRALYELEREAHRYRANVVLIDSALVDDVRALGAGHSQPAPSSGVSDHHGRVVPRRAMAGDLSQTRRADRDHIARLAA